MIQLFYPNISLIVVWAKVAYIQIKKEIKKLSNHKCPSLVILNSNNNNININNHFFLNNSNNNNNNNNNNSIHNNNFNNNNKRKSINFMTSSLIQQINTLLPNCPYIKKTF